MADAPLIYLVACEASADSLGAHLMNALKIEADGRVQFAGVGGPRMAAAGLKTLFNPDELALLGIFEVVPAFPKVLRRVRETVRDIEARTPDVLVTIDSWGFTGRIHQRLAQANSTIPRMRYVAPQVWAWRPGRAKQLARWIHHLMTLLPFEPPYFTRHGLSARWVGHPVLESGADRGDGNAFRARHNLDLQTNILCVLPGSRRGELKKLLPVFGDTVAHLIKQSAPFTVVIPTLQNLKGEVRAATSYWAAQPVVIGPEEIYDAFAASRAAIAASGTVSLELAVAGVPHLIAYRVNSLSAVAFRALRRTPYVNLVNILLDRFAVPEMLQANCTPDKLAGEILNLMTDERARAAQRTDFAKALAQLSPPNTTPSRAAAREVLKIAAHV
jgi:lipid-A-disaccharide synthase